MSHFKKMASSAAANPALLSKNQRGSNKDSHIRLGEFEHSSKTQKKKDKGAIKCSMKGLSASAIHMGNVNTLPPGHVLCDDGDGLSVRRSGRTLGRAGSERQWISNTGRPPMMRQPALQHIDVVLATTDRIFAQTITTFQGGGIALQYGDFTGGADWLSVFDAYRIARIEVTCRPTYTTGITGNYNSQFYTLIDYDDATPETAASAMTSRSDCSLSQYETVVRSFVPHVNVPASAGNTSVEAPWLDAANVVTDHLGFKYGVDGAAGGSTVFQIFTINVRAHVQFRSTR